MRQSFWRPFGCISIHLYRRLIIINIAFPPAIHSKINIRNDFSKKHMRAKKFKFQKPKKNRSSITENKVENTLILGYKIICRSTQHKMVNNFEYGIFFFLIF